MKIVKLDALVQEFSVNGLEELYRQLLSQDSIKTNLPDLSDWQRAIASVDDDGEVQQIDPVRLKQALINYFATCKTPFELAESDVFELCQKLVVIHHLQGVFLDFARESVTLAECEALLKKNMHAQIHFPNIQQKDYPRTFGADDLIPCNAVALHIMDKNPRDLLFRTVKKIKQYDEELTGHDDATAYYFEMVSGVAQLVAKDLGYNELFADEDSDDDFFIQAAMTMQRPQKADANWTVTILDSLHLAKHNKQATNLQSFFYELSPTRINEYVKLQNTIAALIPLEYERPAIILRICGTNRTVEDMIDLGLLGGMGPLSDAHIIAGMLQTGDRDSANILLVSAPPVRHDEKEQDPVGYKAHSKMRMQLLHQMRHAHCRKYGMLSNTAHLHQTKFKLMTTGVRSLLQGVSASKFVHLVDEIAEQIKLKKSKQQMVLILGTTEAMLGDLYFSRIGAENATYQFANRSSNKIIPKEQLALQEYIDGVKSGCISEVAYAFYSDIAAWIATINPTHVLLGCTEIPLLLNYQFKNGKTMLQSLQSHFVTNCPEFIDSEKLMIQIFNHERRLLESQSPLGHILATVNKMRFQLSKEPKDAARKDRESILAAITLALGMENRTEAMDMFNDAIAQYPKYNLVTTRATLLASKIPGVNKFVSSEIAATNPYAKFSHRIGTTSSQSGQILKELVSEVKAYLQRFSAENHSTSPSPK